MTELRNRMIEDMRVCSVLTRCAIPTGWAVLARLSRAWACGHNRWNATWCPKGNLMRDGNLMREQFAERMPARGPIR